MKEDDLVEGLIHTYDEDRDLLPEAHYYHYGIRGAADLCVDYGPGLWILYEVKSPYALQESTGANQIIRQFNKMRSTFFKSDEEKDVNAVRFELTFLPTEDTVRHVMEYHGMYSSCVQTQVCEKAVLPTSSVTLRSPRNPEDSITIANEDKKFPRPGFSSEAKKSNEHLWKEFEHIFRDYI